MPLGEEKVRERKERVSEWESDLAARFHVIHPILIGTVLAISQPVYTRVESDS